MLKSSDNQILNSRNFILYVLFLAICMVCSLTAFGAVEEPVTIETLQQATAASEETTVSAETTTPQQSSKKEISQTDEKTSKETSTQSSPVLSEGGDTEGVLLELTVTTPVSVTALGNTGAATTSIPITVPPGRKGIEPKISLNYNSNSKNGWLGVGWSLDLGAIQRSIKRGVNYSVYDYVFTLNGSSSELVSRGDWGANYYGVKIEGTFSKYYYNSLSGGWEVTTKDGTKYYYGTTLDSRQNNANGVFKWCLDKVQDTNGNYMIITYWKDPVGNDIYLDRIDYTGNISGLNTTNYVKFYLESRTDMPSIYTANSLVKTAYRLKTIEVYGNNQLSRKYVLNYSYSSSTQRSLLTSAVQYGSDGVTYLPESSFGYQERSNQFELETPWGARTQGYSATAGGFRMADVNGDGMADLIYESESGVNPVHVLLSTGSGFVDDNGWGARAHGYNANAVGYQLADVNGDGMADLIYDSDSSVNPVRVLLSTGSGFETDEGWGARTYGYNMNAGGFWMTDVNGDGMADLIYDSDSGEKPVRVLLSTGSGFEADNGWGARTRGYNVDAGGFWMTDVNGDGMADLIYDSDSGVNPVRVLKGATPFSDVLATVNNNIGSTYTLEYLPSSVYDNCMDIDGKTVCLPFVVQTLASVAINGGNGIISTTNYTYSGGFYDYIDREFRGFAYVKSTAPNGTTTETWFKQDDIYKGLPFDQITKDSSGNSYTRTSNTYQYTSPYTGVNFPYLYQKDDYVYDGTSTAKQAETQFIYDSYGNITRKHFLGDISISGDERDEYTEYTYDTTNWIVALPSHVYVNDSSGATKSQAWFTYDTKGNLWTKTMWLNGGTNPVITYGYDPYGNQASMTDAKGNTTTTAYDSTYTYPTVTTNPLGHVITRTYDLKFGKVLTETDVNVNTTTYEYDVFGRTKKITKPMPYGITEYFYQNFGNVSSQNIREEKKDQASVLLHWKETYFDGLGRTRREKSSGPGASTIIVDTEYNNKGLVYTKSLPYYDGGTVYKTTYTYDPMDRLIQTLTPNYPNYTSSSIEYLKDRTTYIDDNGHKKVVEKDIYEKIIKVEEYTGVSPSFTLYATTQYAYDVLNNLTRVTDEYGNLTEITNDTLSRKTSMHDPDMGYWTYQYDANGNLISQTDAKNQTITFTYDALNRITKKDYPTGTDITYTYDELFSTNPIGKQTTLTDSSGTTKFYYDAMGQITRTDKTIDSMLYITQTQYDSLGRVKKIIYPDSAEVDYTYDGNGNIKDIISGTQTYLTYNSYNAFAQPLSVTNGNGVTTQYQYYAQNNRLFSITTNSPTQGGLMNFTYSYDSAGNITSIDDLMDNNKDRTYTYDDLDRLIGANSLSYGGNLIYQYDKTGNMTYNCKYGYYFYDDLNHIHAVTKIKKADGTLIDSYSYDANGNMTGGAGRALTYNYDNMPTSIGYNNNATINVYDANGIRVKKVTPTSTTVYIGQTYECANGVCMKYIMSGTQIIAQISGSDTNYYHTDHLGSSSIITDNTGNKVEDIYYYPYGEIKTNTGSANVRYKYTGKEFDAEDGLYYYGARYYDPRLARFISADTIVPLPFYPQTFNRYAYAYNNPIVLRDLDGHEPGDYWDYYDYYDYDDYYDYSSYYDYNNNSYQNSYYNSYSYGNSSYSDYSWSSYSSSNSSWNSYNSYSWGDYSLTDRYRQSNSYNEVLVDRSKNTISFQNNTFEIRYGRLGPGEYKIDYIGTGFSRENPLETKKARGESYGTAYIGLAGTSMDIHGGGKGAKTEAWAPVQGWYPTQGCYRMQNRDINALSIDLNSYRNSTGGYPIVRIQE